MNMKDKFIAELLGTFFLILLGCGSVAMVVLFGSPDSAVPANGGYTTIIIGWGFAVMFGVYVSGTISGAHLNPAVTIAMAVTKRLPMNHVVPYIVAQFIGAFLGALCVFAVYYGQWVNVDPELMNTAGVFATTPYVKDLAWPGFVDQVVGTFVLVFAILAMTDDRSAHKTGAFTPIVVGFLIMAIGSSLGAMHGYAINPARDLGPRLFSLVAGFSNNGFEELSIWLVPVIAPIVGALVAVFAYDSTIGCALKTNKK